MLAGVRREMAVILSCPLHLANIEIKYTTADAVLGRYRDLMDAHGTINTSLES
jgi:hypothetical protein